VAIALLLAGLTGLPPALGAGEPIPILGFPGEASQAQRQLEAQFAARIDRQHIRDTLRELGAKPHHAGSQASADLARELAGRFRSWGFDARIETFHGLMSTPKELVLEMLAPVRYRAALADGPFPGAPAPDLRDSLPPFSMFSKDGDVTAEAVYVNFGTVEDYEVLARQGIAVQGRIVIARYGKSWRGAKLRLAAAQGAVGAIFFGDPDFGGYAQGAVYPEGPYLPANGAQRGSVLDITRMAGDPLTPGKGATRRPQGFSVDDAAEWISPIPVQPVSAREIEPIMAAMRGPMAPADWRGGMPVAYRLGDGSVKLRLKVSQEWTVTPLYDVVARLEGSALPDEWVMRGNNHDAWNFGAEDALSGLAAMLEEARAIGALAQAGWRPRRTLVYLAWDGEERGLFGSTEWVETHADELRRKAVAYLNSGPLARGFFAAGGSHSLRAFVDGIARDVDDPLLARPVAERVAARERLQQIEAGPDADLPAAPWEFPLDALGMSSDYGAFLHHLGIASLDFTFGGESENGCFHSICDDFSHYEKFSDPGFAYAAALAEAGGRMMLRLGEAQILPFDFSGTVQALAGYVDELEGLVDALRRQTARQNAAIADGTHALAQAPHAAVPAQQPQPPVPAIDFTPIRRAHQALADHADRFTAARSAREAGGLPLAPGVLARVNRAVASAEQALAPAHGLPGRPWYRHQLYAPSYVTGYEASTLPGVRDALERRDWPALQREIARTAQAIAEYAAIVSDAATLLAD